MKNYKVERIKDNSKPTRYFSSKQEKRVAKDLNGNLSINSGATPFSKGDLSLDEFSIECKTKTKHSDTISIKKEWLEKINEESLFMGKPYWALCFNFGPDEDNYFILDEITFKELVDNGKR